MDAKQEGLIQEIGPLCDVTMYSFEMSYFIQEFRVPNGKYYILMKL